MTVVVDGGSSLHQFISLEQPLSASHVQPGDARVEPDIKKGTQTNLQMWCIAPLSHKWSRFGRSMTETPNIEGPGVVSIETDPYAKRSLSKVFLRKRQKDYGGKKRKLDHNNDNNNNNNKGCFIACFFPLCKSPSKNILTMIKMFDLNSTIMWLRMARAPPNPPFFIITSLFSFEVWNWKERVVDRLRDAWALCFAGDTSPACPLNHWHFLPLSPLPLKSF